VAFNINGFDNRYVNRLLMVGNSTNSLATPNPIINKYESPVQHNNKVQFRVNGRNLLPSELDSPNQKLARLTDAFDTFTVIPGQNTPWINDVNFVNTEDRDLYGSTDYTGVIIGQRINELQVQYQRDALYSATNTNREEVLNAPLNMNFWAEVRKAIVPQGDSYKIMYA
jgi:hypothetical protein